VQCSRTYLKAGGKIGKQERRCLKTLCNVPHSEDIMSQNTRTALLRKTKSMSESHDPNLCINHTRPVWSIKTVSVLKVHISRGRRPWEGITHPSLKHAPLRKPWDHCTSPGNRHKDRGAHTPACSRTCIDIGGTPGMPTTCWPWILLPAQS
jgi:hypothetical protein